MDHVAIMRKSWGLIPKILDGRKKIESRWGRNRCAPWGKVNIGDTIYFKNAGEKVTVKVRVIGIKQFGNLNPFEVEKILREYGGDDGIAVRDLGSMIQWARGKRYCTLIYLGKPQVVKPFEICKRGFGAGAAWLSVNDIYRIKRAS